MCMNCGLFEEALKHLQTVVTLEKRDWNKVLPLINLAKCQLAINEQSNANESTKKLLAFLENKEVVAKLAPVFEICNREIEELITQFIEIGSTNQAITLNCCKVKLIAKLCKGITKLQNLGLVGNSMYLLAKEMQKKQSIFIEYQGCRSTETSLEQEIKNHSALMNKILSQMNDVTVITENQQKKIVEIVWFLQSYGFCCDLLGNYDKSVGLYSQAKTLLESTIGGESTCYKTLGHCYNTVVESHKRAMQSSSKAFQNVMFKSMLLFFVLVATIVFETIEAVKLSKELDEQCNQTIEDENEKPTVSKFILHCLAFVLIAINTIIIFLKETHKSQTDPKTT